MTALAWASLAMLLLCAFSVADFVFYIRAKWPDRTKAGLWRLLPGGGIYCYLKFGKGDK